MDEMHVRTLLSELADAEAPPARVDIDLAVNRGRRDRRWRQAISGGSTLAIAAVAGAVVTLVAVPGSGTAVTPHAGGPGTPVRSASATPSAGTTPSASATVSSSTLPFVAPKQFDPMVPYASFGWLPAGYTTGGGAGSQLSVNTRSESLSAGYGSTGATWFSLQVTVAGACKESGSAALPVLNCNYGDSTSGPMRATSPAADVNGQPAFWVNGSDYAYLFWQYAPGAWSVLGAPTKLPRWPLTPARQAMLHQVAANVRYADTTPIRFPFWFTGVPAGWTANSASFGVTPSGDLAGQGLSLGPAIDPGALGIGVIPTPPGSSCKFIAGQSQHVTLDGVSAVLRTLDEPGKGYQSLCAADVSGLQVYIRLDTTETASNTPLPGAGGLGGALGVARALHLLGADPAFWTTRPLR